jgi:hypothetical protein
LNQDEIGDISPVKIGSFTYYAVFIDSHMANFHRCKVEKIYSMLILLIRKRRNFAGELSPCRFCSPLCFVCVQIFVPDYMSAMKTASRSASESSDRAVFEVIKMPSGAPSTRIKHDTASSSVLSAAQAQKGMPP